MLEAFLSVAFLPRIDKDNPTAETRLWCSHFYPSPQRISTISSMPIDQDEALPLKLDSPVVGFAVAG